MTIPVAPSAVPRWRVRGRHKSVLPASSAQTEAAFGVEAGRHFANQKGADDTEMRGEIAHVSHPNG